MTDVGSITLPLNYTCLTDSISVDLCLFAHVKGAVTLAVCGVFTLRTAEDVPKGEEMKVQTES